MRKAFCRIILTMLVALAVGCSSDRPGDRMIYEPWHYYSREETACALRRAMCGCCAYAKPPIESGQVAASRQPVKKQIARAKPHLPPSRASSSPVQVAKSASRTSKVKPSSSADIRTCAGDESSDSVKSVDGGSRQNAGKDRPSPEVGPNAIPPVRSPPAANEPAIDVAPGSWHPPAKVVPEPN